jgi:hypothetical protein
MLFTYIYIIVCMFYISSKGQVGCNLAEWILNSEKSKHWYVVVLMQLMVYQNWMFKVKVIEFSV